MALETVKEDEEVYSWREVQLLHIAELEREKLERKRGRDIIIAVDHGPNSKYAFDWALIHFCRLADTLHLVHAVSNVKNEIVYNASEELMVKLAMEALQVAMVGIIRVVLGVSVTYGLFNHAWNISHVKFYISTVGDLIWGFQSCT
ncbi:unnamed protein product [Malus baccata var. baccata]